MSSIFSLYIHYPCPDFPMIRPTMSREFSHEISANFPWMFCHFLNGFSAYFSIFSMDSVNLHGFFTDFPMDFTLQWQDLTRRVRTTELTQEAWGDKENWDCFYGENGG